MISKTKIKSIRQLELKKQRVAKGLFVAEGPKVVADLMQRFSIHTLVATHECLQTLPAAAPNTEVIEVTADELRKVSFLQHPQGVLAVMGMPTATGPDLQWPENELVLALDGVQDPGNLGTIIRIADWFGITHVVCSGETADVYNPKVVQATMGSLARVEVCYTQLPQYVELVRSQAPVYGTLLEGESLYDAPLSTHGLIIMGNEGNGLSPAIRQMLTQSLFIPNYPRERATADSLNVAVATAIICAEFRRKNG